MELGSQSYQASKIGEDGQVKHRQILSSQAFARFERTKKRKCGNYNAYDQITARHVHRDNIPKRKRKK